MPARCSIANDLAACSKTTSERPHEFFDPMGISPNGAPTPGGTHADTGGAAEGTCRRAQQRRPEFVTLYHGPAHRRRGLRR